jgi:hypothetical protein
MEAKLRVKQLYITPCDVQIHRVVFFQRAVVKLIRTFGEKVLQFA